MTPVKEIPPRQAEPHSGRTSGFREQAVLFAKILLIGGGLIGGLVLIDVMIK